MTAPRYLTRASEQAFAPPYGQAGCALHGFALPAVRERLSALVERFLVAPSGGRLEARVEAEHVLLYFCDFARSLSLAPSDIDRGWLGERECGIWIPIVVPGASAPTFMVHSMFVDSGPAMVSGREVLGFPKQIGLVSVEREPAQAHGFGLEVLSCAAQRDEPGRWRTLVEFERLSGSRAAGMAPSLAHTLSIGSELLGTRAPAALAQRALRAQAEFINLKQFRHASQPELACYQALVRCRARLLGLRRIAATASYGYRIHRLASHPLAAELGLASEGTARGITCEFDFELGEAQELHA